MQKQIYFHNNKQLKLKQKKKKKEGEAADILKEDSDKEDDPNIEIIDEKQIQF